MAIEYLGLSAINGPMVVLEGVSGAAYDEIVEMAVQVGAWGGSLTNGHDYKTEIMRTNFTTIY